MKNFSNITAAAVTLLENDVGMSNIFKKVYRSDYINQDPNNAPWCCVYRGKTLIEPRTLGAGVNNWEYQPTLRIAVQATSSKSGDDCETLLEDYVQRVLNAMAADLTIGGTVDMIKSINVEPLYNEAVRSDMYFQTSIIEFDLEVSTA